MIPFQTFPYQDECVEEFKNNQFVIVNKSRQLGLSTVCAAYALWLCIFHKEKNVLIIATKLEVAKNFQAKVFTMFDNLPKWLVMPSVVQRSIKTLKFSNGSKIQAVPTSPDAGRGEALSLLLVDECAHIEGIDDLWLALSPSLSTGGRAILISTPNGVGNLFHRIWTGAQEGTNGFKPIEIPWYKHPQRDQKWYDIQAKAIRAAKGERGVAQELECNFNASGDTFLPPEHMDVLFSRVTDPPWKHPVYPECWVWKQPNPNHRYVIGADVSRGDAEDFSAFCVVDIDDDEVVADYKAKIQSDKLADVLIEIGKYYNTALICPELNSYGLLTSDALKKSGYPNLYYDKLRKNVYQVMTQSEMTNSDELPGIQMHVKNREEILAKFETVLRNGHIITHSKRLYEELKTFMWRNNKAQAQKGYNDDIIMAYAMTFSLFEASGRNLYSDEDMAMGLLAGMSTNTNTLVPFGQGFNPSDSIALPIFTNSSLARQNKFLEKKRQFELQSKINPSFESNRIANNPQHPLSPLWGEFAWVAKD